MYSGLLARYFPCPFEAVPTQGQDGHLLTKLVHSPVFVLVLQLLGHVSHSPLNQRILHHAQQRIERRVFLLLQQCFLLKKLFSQLPQFVTHSCCTVTGIEDVSQIQRTIEAAAAVLEML